MNVFELARMPRVALMAEFVRISAPIPAGDRAVTYALQTMTRECLVTAILRHREPPPEPLPKRHPVLVLAAQRPERAVTSRKGCA